MQEEVTKQLKTRMKETVKKKKEKKINIAIILDEPVTMFFLFNFIFV